MASASTSLCRHLVLIAAAALAGTVASSAENPTGSNLPCQLSNEDLNKDCGVECLTKPEGEERSACGKQCLEKKQVPSECAECVGNQIDCSLSHCVPKCMDSASEECKGCVRDTCGICSHAEEPVPPADPADPAELPCQHVDAGANKDCGMECLTKPEGEERSACGKQCLENKQVPSECAECAGKVIDCTLSHCVPKCMGAEDGEECKDCVFTECGRCSPEESRRAADAEAKNAAPPLFP